MQRAQPWLGTLVSIGCVGLPEGEACRRIDEAFSAIAQIHALMSFHEPGSDVTRLNEEAFVRPVAVHAHTYAVLELAQSIARVSNGAFDVTAGGALSEWGRLPRLATPVPDAAANWADVELMGDGIVRFHRPLWIDLGGIAKGYAVDQAVVATDVGDEGRLIINAGGDLRVAGRGAELITLDPRRSGGLAVPIVELSNASLASSTGRGFGGRMNGKTTGSHVDVRRRRAVGGRSFVAVAAQDCAVADALTKVVLVRRKGALPCLKRFGATAFFNDGRGQWATIGEVHDEYSS